MKLSDIVDKLHDKHGLADTGTTEKTNLTTLGVWAQKIDNLNTGDKKLLSGTLLFEGGRLSVDGKEFGGFDWTALIDGLTDHINDSAESFLADRDFNGILSVSDGLSTNQALRRVQSNGAHVIASQVLGDLKDEAVRGALNLERIENRRKFTFELYIDDGADHLGNLTGGGAEATLAGKLGQHL
jgi:hypothetical protein